MLHMPVDVRNLSLALLTLFASVALLHWASAVFIPIMISLLLTTALRPAVEILWRWHVPRWLGAGVLLIAIVAAISLTMRKRPGLKQQDVARQVAVRREDRVRIIKMPAEVAAKPETPEKAP